MQLNGVNGLQKLRFDPIEDCIDVFSMWIPSFSRLVASGRKSDSALKANF